RDGAALTVAVNLSVDNLHDAHFQRYVDLTLKVAGGPELLIVEASSRALARDPAPPVGTLELMRDRGIRVTLDDATEEDAHILESFPADIVKVSRGLITRMGRDHRALEYVRAVLRAARECGLEATAVGVEVAADGRLFVTERGGRARIMQLGPGAGLRSEPWATLPASTVRDGEKGLLGIALDPDFARNGSVYLYYSYPASNGASRNKVVRLHAENGRGTEAAVMLDGMLGNSNHAGGRVK